MKNTFFLLLIALTACAQKEPLDVKIHGTVEAFPEGTVVLLNATTRDTMTKGEIHNGEFNLNWLNKSDKIEPAFIACNDAEGRISLSAPLALEPGNLSVHINRDGFPSYKGTPMQERFSTFVEEVTDLSKAIHESAIGDSDSLVNALSNRMDVFYAESRLDKMKPFAAQILADQINRSLVDPAHMPQISALCENDSVSDESDLLICNAIVRYYENWNGVQAPDFETTDADGSTLKLSSVYGEKPVLIDFWASWCGPCVKEIPKLKALHETGTLQIIGISIDDNDAAWRKALTKLELPWQNVRDTDRSLRQLYNVTAVPTKLLIDKEGIVVIRNPADLEEALRALE